MSSPDTRPPGPVASTPVSVAGSSPASWAILVARGVQTSWLAGFGAPAVSLDRACKGSQAYLQLATEIIDRQALDATNRAAGATT